MHVRSAWISGIPIIQPFYHFHIGLPCARFRSPSCLLPLLGPVLLWPLFVFLRLLALSALIC